MNIEVKIRRLFNENRMRAIASVTLDGIMAIHDIKVIEGKERVFVAMPSHEDDAGTFRDIVHPIGAEFRAALEGAVLQAYREQLKQ